MRRTIQPPCPRCGKRMTLTRVDPHTPGYETRTFDCSRCGYSVGEVVKIPSPEP
jgi:C4-type Zn-finger protein